MLAWEMMMKTRRNETRKLSVWKAAGQRDEEPLFFNNIIDWVYKRWTLSSYYILSLSNTSFSMFDILGYARSSLHYSTDVKCFYSSNNQRKWTFIGDGQLMIESSRLTFSIISIEYHRLLQLIWGGWRICLNWGESLFCAQISDRQRVVKLIKINVHISLICDPKVSGVESWEVEGFVFQLIVNLSFSSDVN